MPVSNNIVGGVETPCGATDASGLPLEQVGKGWKVYDTNQAGLLGRVDEATPGFLRLRHGVFARHTLVIPGRLVGSVDAGHHRVFLTQASKTLAAMHLAT
ncbi:MAG: hypothetical protein ACR2PL_24580 [Dehalococcoidia bacterium]